MADLNSRAFQATIAAGTKLYASKRLNTMTNDEAMKALATEILQTYVAIAVEGALTSARECAAWVNKALFLDLTQQQELLLADVIGKALVADRARHQAVAAENATCKGGLQVGNLISYAKWRGDYRILESGIGDPAEWESPPDVVLPVYCDGVAEALERYSITPSVSEGRAE
ncbi:hypothetical protein KYK30_32715 [Shinella yambaruensis]|uniref:Uncharacterized protein n=1 Tax=Shinella yambaruensis TaxID=415996 RepID=A0ABQ5ZV84_9HYPH|nr:hypothetical protein [Shinella yambaruensis]MCU7984483.1 hypothetical protein [Shinella yambaruensis]GLR54986.1 hypothetical protein GCM10007923_62070 [Shinella yambaruensis]